MIVVQTSFKRKKPVSDVLLQSDEPTMEISGGVIRLSAFGSTMTVEISADDFKRMVAAVRDKGDAAQRAALVPPPTPPPAAQQLNPEALCARIFRALRLYPSEPDLYGGDMRRDLGVRVIEKLLYRSGYSADIEFYHKTCTAPHRRTMGHTIDEMMRHSNEVVRSATPHTGMFAEALKWIESNGGVAAISRRFIELEQQRKAAADRENRERRRRAEEVFYKEQEELIGHREKAAKPAEPPPDPITYVPPRP